MTGPARNRRWLVVAASSRTAAEQCAWRNGLEVADVLTKQEALRLGAGLRKFACSRNADALLVHSSSWARQATPQLFDIVALAAGVGTVAFAEGDGPPEILGRSALLASAARVPFEVVAGATGALVGASRALRSPIGPSPVRLLKGGDTAVVFWRGAAENAVGGSVTHIAGVLGAFRALGFRTALLTVTPPPEQLRPLVDELAVASPLRRSRRISRDVESIAVHTPLVAAGRDLLTRVSGALVYARHDAFQVAGAQLALESGLPLVLEWNSSEVWTHANWLGRRPLQGIFLPLLETLERRVVAAVDLVAAVSERAAEMACAAGADPAKVVVTPNAVDLIALDTAIGAGEPRGAPPDGPCRLGWVGTFGPWHGAERLIEATALLPERVELVLVGDGVRRRACEELATSLGLESRITWTGALSHDDALRTLAACDVLASPHAPLSGQAFFGSPTKIFEYMALARPIVATRLEQLAEILDDGRSAALATPGDPADLARAVLRVLDAPDGGLEMATAARRDVEEHHTWVHRVVTILERLDVSNPVGVKSTQQVA